VLLLRSLLYLIEVGKHKSARDSTPAQSNHSKAPLQHLCKSLKGIFAPIIEPNIIANPNIIEADNKLVPMILSDIAENLLEDKQLLICKISEICK
jgi:hypothetical protein